MRTVLNVVRSEISFKLKWLRETRAHVRLLLEENPNARIGNIKKFMLREQEDLIKLRKIKKLLIT